MPHEWETIRAWRKIQRGRLLARRKRLNSRQLRQASQGVIDNLRRYEPSLRQARIGFYWPMHGEIDLRPLVRDVLSAGAKAALPVIVNESQPLEFWRWNPQDRLCKRGLWGIPAPLKRDLVRPTVLLVPLLGFDLNGYRLGHGGGYYDRTLATIDPMPLSLGIGYEFSCLETIYPQPHDVTLDGIITEDRIILVKPR